MVRCLLNPQLCTDISKMFWLRLRVDIFGVSRCLHIKNQRFDKEWADFQFTITVQSLFWQFENYLQTS